MHRTCRLFMSIAGILATFAATTARAQGVGIDHGALEQIFNEPVTVSATGKPQRASEVPVTMEIVTAEQIRRSGAPDIPAVLRDVVGVDDFSASLTGADIGIRGYNTGGSRRVLVLLNGRQVYQDFYGTVQWSLVPVQLDEIRQIEVVKGPASALYGFNAVGGVINIVTMSPLYDDANSVRVRSGNQNQRQGSAVVTVKPTDRVGIRLSAGGFWADDTSADPGGFAEQVRANPHQRSLMADGLLRLADEAELGLEMSYAAGPESRFGPGMTPLKVNSTALSGKTTLSVNTALGLFAGQVYHNSFDWTIRSPNRQVSPIYNSATVASLQDLFKIGAEDNFRLSLEYRFDEASTVNSGRGGLQYSVYSGGAMWDHSFGSDLSLTNSVRFDHLTLGHSGDIDPRTPIPADAFDRSLNGATFNSGLVWRATPVDTARASVGRGLQLPSLGDLGAIQQFQPTPTPDLRVTDFFGMPRLQPVTVTNYELSYDRRLPQLDTTLTGSVFYQTNQDVISSQGARLRINPVTRRSYFFQENVGDSDTVGVELGAKGEIGDRWTWSVNYAWQHIWDIDRPTQDPAHPLPPLSLATETSHHKVNARLGYTVGPLELDLGIHYRSSLTMTDTSLQSGVVLNREIPDLVMLAPRIGYHLTDRVTAEVSAQGLWPRREALYSTLDSRVLFSVIGRW